MIQNYCYRCNSFSTSTTDISDTRCNCESKHDFPYFLLAFVIFIFTTIAVMLWAVT